MSDETTAFLTDPEIARRIRRTADDLAVERRRVSEASEGLEAELRELADEIHEEPAEPTAAPVFPARRGSRARQDRLPI